MQLASSPEAFLTLRANFVRSVGVASICQYLLGIGDRHLSNYMVDLGSGAIVAIDFGHAFGTATQVTPAGSQHIVIIYSSSPTPHTPNTLSYKILLRLLLPPLL